MKKKFLLLLLAAVTLLCLFTSCDGGTEPGKGSEVKITLNGSSAEVSGKGADVSGSVITITAPGEYRVSGKLDNGQIVVALTEKENVTLILDSADITCLTSAPIYVKACKNCIVVLADGTINSVTDSASYQYENALDSEPSAAIFSKTDLKIRGEGTLLVNAKFNNGIASKDSLKIESGSINVTAPNNGLKGKDDVTIEGGIINVTSEGDAIKSDKSNDLSLGYVEIRGGSLHLTAKDEGIQAETNVVISGGSVIISSDSNGIKATYGVEIAAGVSIEITARKEGVVAQTVTGSAIVNGTNVKY